MTEERWEMTPGCEMVRRPVATAPDDVTLCFVDSGGRFTAARRRAGKWDDGKGRALSVEPTHWSIWASGDPLAKKAGANV